MTERLVKVYSVFNRVWHWSQVASIFVLLFTGLRVMGLHGLIPFKAAVVLHSAAAVWITTAARNGISSCRPMTLKPVNSKMRIEAT